MGTFIGIIDLGSNTARLVVYYKDEQGSFYEFDNIKRVLRLSNHLQPNGLISETGFQETMDCMRQFKELCDARQVSEVIGVATAAVRQASNGQELLAAIHRNTGIPFRLLTGEEEAYYGYLAVVNSMNVSDGISVDLGGGSTEVTLIRDRKLQESHSFPFGIVTLTKRFLQREIPTDQEIVHLKQFLQQQFSSRPWLFNQKFPLIAMGGTARNLGKIHQQQIHYPMASLHHYLLDDQSVDRIFQWIRKLSLEQRKEVNGLSKDRADVIIAGIAVFQTLMEWIGTKQLIVSNKGLRDGVLYEKVLPLQNISCTDDIIRISTEQFMNRYQVPKGHAQHVKNLACTLFDELKDLQILNLGANERKLLEIAALLHDVGRSINVYEASQHTFYLLSNVLLLGLTHKQRILIAMTASYKNNKQLQQQQSRYAGIVDKSDKEMVEKLGHLVLLARILDRSMSQQIRSIRLLEKKKNIVIECTSIKENLLEYALLEDILKRVSKVFTRSFSFVVKTPTATFTNS